MISALLLIALLIPSLADAACSGSGVTWTCPAGSTIADVETAMGSATDGATITFASGAYSWTTGSIDTFSSSKGVTLICEVALACDISLGTIQPFTITYTGTWTKLIRISGFDFTGDRCSGDVCIAINTSGPASSRLEQFRFDHNRLTDFNVLETWIQIGDIANGGEVWALFDHNTVTAASSHNFVHTLGKGNIENSTVWGDSHRGTNQATYIEDNTFDFIDNGSFVSCTDGWRMANVVFRFNTVHNCRLQVHGVPHGSVMLYENYGNAITADGATNPTCYTCIQTQGGGEYYVWGNSLTSSTTLESNAIQLQDYRASTAEPGGYGICDGTNVVDGNLAPTATYRGYPCLGNPGRYDLFGTPTLGKLAPNAIWKNINGTTGAKVDVALGGQTYIAEHLVANRDYYNAVSATAQTSTTSPFDGTTGIGHGTLANRPTICTHTTAPDGDEGGGVMYWATDQGSWNQSASNPYGVNQSGADGVLYRCSVTNTWTVHYTPYTYPHPLQGTITASALTGTISFTGGVTIQ